MRNAKFGIDDRWLPALKVLESIENLEERATSLRTRDFGPSSPEEIYKTVCETLIYLPLEISFSRPYSIDRFPVYRARNHLNEEVENSTLARTHSYPSPSIVRSNGRANVVGRPVFYCSDSPGTALAEIKPVVNEVIYLGEWLIRCHRPSAHVSIFPFPMKSNNPWVTIAQNRQKERIDFFKSEFGENVAMKVQYIFDFLADLFGKDTPPYSISSSLANHYLYEVDGIDYVIYPSFQTVGATCNLVFHPNFTDEFCRLDKVYKMRTREVLKDRALVEVLSVAEYMMNQFRWREPNDHDISFMPEAW